MARRTTILVPVDFSEASRAAVRRAQSLATESGQGLRLLHVYAPPSADLDARWTEALYEELLHDSRMRLASLAAEFDDGALAVDTAFEEGEPARVIHDAANEEDVSLVVMGSHGRKGFDRWLLGSVAARVVRQSPRSVLVVRGEGVESSEPTKPLRSILLATDFSERAAAVEPEVAAWARRFRAEVEVLHVIRETSVLLAPYAVVGSSDFEGEMLEAAECRMREVLRRFQELGVEAKAKIVYGLPAEEILRRAESTNVDLVAMGTRGYARLQRFLLGSVAQRVLAQSPCDVLVDAGSVAPVESRNESLRVGVAWAMAFQPGADGGARAEAIEVTRTRPPVESAHATTEERLPEAVHLEDDEWVPPEADDFGARLFAVVMTGVLGVILAMAITGWGM